MFKRILTPILTLALMGGMALSASAETMTYFGNCYITAYCDERYPHICGGSGVTAMGVPTQVGVTCGATKDLPLGTKVYIEGVGYRIVQDRGSGNGTKHIDVLCATHQDALHFEGYGHRDVWIVTE